MVNIAAHKHYCRGAKLTMVDDDPEISELARWQASSKRYKRFGPYLHL